LHEACHNARTIGVAILGNGAEEDLAEIDGGRINHGDETGYRAHGEQDKTSNVQKHDWATEFLCFGEKD